MIYRIRWVEYKSARRNLLGQIITRKIRGGEIRFYRVEAAKLEEREKLR